MLLGSRIGGEKMKQIKLSDPINLKELLESYNRSMNSFLSCKDGFERRNGLYPTNKRCIGLFAKWFIS